MRRHQHHLRLDRQRAGDADALLHAAGELGRPLVLGAGEADEVDEFLRLRADLGGVPAPPFGGDRVGDVAHHRAPRQQRMALEDHRAVEARARDRLVVDDDGAFGRFVEAREDVQYSGLTAARMADDAGELAAVHREPQVLENRRRPARGRIPLRNPFQRNELVRHRPHSGNVTMRANRARI